MTSKFIPTSKVTSIPTKPHLVIVTLPITQVFKHMSLLGSLLFKQSHLNYNIFVKRIVFLVRKVVWYLLQHVGFRSPIYNAYLVLLSSPVSPQNLYLILQSFTFSSSFICLWFYTAFIYFTSNNISELWDSRLLYAFVYTLLSYHNHLCRNLYISNIPTNPFNHFVFKPVLPLP